MPLPGPAARAGQSPFLADPAWNDARDRSRADVLIAPPLACGSGGEHAGFTGILSIGHICRSYQGKAR